MRLIFWVTALAVLSIACGKNSTTKTKPKRQLESIRNADNLQYSLVLPHSRVSHFRALNNNNRRISHGGANGGKLPPYAVQMEPVVQYSQKDPLYDPNLENLDDSVVSKNEIYAQSKILNTQDSSLESFGPPYGSLPTAPLYSQEPHQHYYEAPEPIIEIIIKESNESLPAPPPPPVQKKKKEPVHVFYVKYSKDPNSKDKVIYEKPIPAITPPSNDEDENEHNHHEEYVTVTPEPYIPLKTTTLRAIIKPESEVYHSDSSVRVTFGSEGHHHYSDRREGSTHSEEESNPRPAIAIPNQASPSIHPPIERSASPKPQYSHETETKSTIYHSNNQYRPNGQHAQHAQSRIQFQPQSFPTDQQLPRQGPSVVPFRAQQPHGNRNPFASPSSLIPNPAFANGPPGIITYNKPTAPTPLGPVFPTTFTRPSNGPPFHSRPNPNNPPQFGARTQFNAPTRTSFHSGPQRPFHQPQAAPKPYFDEAKYLQENYHTITTEQVDPPKEQLLPSRPTQTFNRIPQASPSPTPIQFSDHYNRPQGVQQLPQQRPTQHFESLPVSPSPSPFFNLKPSPPHIESHRVPFQPPSQQFSFHQGAQLLPSPSASPVLQSQHSFSRPNIANPSPSAPPQHQFLPQPSSSPIFNFQPSPTPEQHNFFHQSSPSERPQFQQSHNPSDRPPFFQHQGSSERPPFPHQSNTEHHRNVAPFVPNGGELIAAIPKYEQHITVTGPTAQPNYSGFSETSQPSSAPSHNVQQYHQHQHQQQQQQHHQHQQPQQHQQQQQHHQHQQPQQPQQQQPQQHQLHQQQQHEQQQQQHKQQQQQHQQQQHQQQQHQQQQHQQQQQQQHQSHQQHEIQQQQERYEQQQQRHQEHQQYQQQQKQQRQQQQQQHQQQHQQQQQIEQYDPEQEQVRLQLAENVKKQQEEIQRLQTQLLLSQQQQQQHNANQYQQIQVTSPRSQYIQERSKAQPSTASPAYYQSTSRTVEIKPTTHKYVSSTVNSVSSTPAPEKKEKKKPTFELPDEVPDDLRQHLLSSGILDNADISVLDYDKVGETPLESLPPDQLANFFGAGGGQQIASSENHPVYIKPNGDQVESRMIDEMEDQELAASENVPSYAVPPKQAVDMKVVHFDPNTDEGKNIARKYVQPNATQVEPVALNDKKYNRYLPLKVSGNQFPLPDILKGRKVTSVVVLAPVETETLKDEHSRKERAAASSASGNLKGIKFIAGDSLQNVLKKPSKDNFEKWLDVEKKTSSDLQSIVLLVTGDETPEEEDREIFMYDVTSGNVNKLSGELSNAFVEAAENNALSKDIETLAIEGEGIPEDFNKDDAVADGSENVPLFVDLSGVSLDDETDNHVSILSGYSKTKLGRALRRN